MHKDDGSAVLAKTSLLKSQMICFLLILTYCAVFGFTAQIVLTSWQLLYFTTSVLFALSIVHLKNKEIQIAKIKKGIIANQVVGTALIFSYVLIYGVSSLAILTGLQLAFFMSSYVFAMSVIYINENRVKDEILSFSTTTPFFTSYGKINLSNEEILEIISDINNSLSTIIGFSELMIRRDYNEHEKEHMIKVIFEQAISISHSTDKLSSNITDSTTNPKPLIDLDGSTSII